MKNNKYYLKIISLGCISLLSVLTHTANAQILYATDGTNYGNGLVSSLYKIDTNSGAVTTVGPVGYDVADIAWDRTRNALYGAVMGRASTDQFEGLISIDTNTGAETIINTWKDPTGTPYGSNRKGVQQIDIDSKVNMYGANHGLSHIDSSTGIVTPTLPIIIDFDIGGENFPLTLDAGRTGFSFDNSDKLWRDRDFFDHNFHAISTDLTTGITSPSISGIFDGDFIFSGGTLLQGEVGRHGTFDLTTDLYWAVFDNTITQYDLNTGKILKSLDLVNAPDIAGSLHKGIRSLAFAPVPVPAAVWLFGSGLIGLVSFPKRQKT